MKRFVIDLKDDDIARDIKVMLMDHQSNNRLTFIDMGDPIEKARHNLTRIKEVMELLETTGISHEVLLAYIKYKTKISVKDIKKMLDAQSGFFNSIGD